MFQGFGCSAGRGLVAAGEINTPLHCVRLLLESDMVDRHCGAFVGRASPSPFDPFSLLRSVVARRMFSLDALASLAGAGPGSVYVGMTCECRFSGEHDASLISFFFLDRLACCGPAQLRVAPCVCGSRRPPRRCGARCCLEHLASGSRRRGRRTLDKVYRQVLVPYPDNGNGFVWHHRFRSRASSI